MIYFLALIPATALTIAGYFALYLSTRMEGGLRTFGKYLGVWAFTLAALIVLGAIFAAAHGGHHRMGWHGMRGMHGPGQMSSPWHRGFGPPPEHGPPPPAGSPGAPGTEPTPSGAANAPSAPTNGTGSPSSH